MCFKAGWLKRALLDMAFGGFLQKLADKLAAEGRILVKVDPRNTSRTCSHYGYVSKKNRRSQAVFVCVRCGYSNNADINAAINIKNLFLDSLEAGSDEGQGMPRWPGGNSTQTKKSK